MATVKDRISAMYPGDANKAIRHRIYSTKGILDGNPTDDQIRAAAGEGSDDPAPEADPTQARLVKPVQDQVAELLAKVPTMKVVTAQDYEQAAVWFASLKAMGKMVEAKRVELKAPHLAENKRIDDEAKAMQGLLSKALTPIEQEMAAFKAREAEELRRQEAERQAALKAEQDRLAAEAEAARAQAAEVEAQVEEDPFLAAIMGDQVAEAKQTASSAALALAIGVDESAVPEVAKATTAAGVRSVTRWKWRITNEEAVPRHLCSPDERKLNELVRNAKASGGTVETFAQNYPGIEIYEEISIEGGR